jgi:putative N6-adenine-specific DNA methylase
VADIVRVFKYDARSIKKPGVRGSIVTNPPYGERLMDEQEVEELYKSIGNTFRALAPWQIYVLSSVERFEKLYGKRPDKVKKLYNGMIPCYLYQYFKQDK